MGAARLLRGSEKAPFLTSSRDVVPITPTPASARPRARRWRLFGTITPRALACQLLAAAATALAGVLPMPYAWLMLGLAATSAFGVVLFSVNEERPWQRALRVGFAAALYALGAWAGGHPLVLAATLVAMGTALIPLTWIEAARAVDNTAQRRRLRQALESAELATARQVERAMRQRMSEVERATVALRTVVEDPTPTPLASGLVPRATEASRALRETLTGLATPRPDVAVGECVAPPPRGAALHAHRIRRYWARGMRADVLRIAPPVAVMLAPGLLIPEAQLDPVAPLVLYPAVTALGWLAAPRLARPAPATVLLAACGFVMGFMAVMGLVVVRSGPQASLAYALGFAVCMLGHARNLRATAARPLMALPFVGGALLALPFAYDVTRALNLLAALGLGLGMGALLGRAIEREDEQLDQQEALQALLAADTGQRVEAAVASRRQELLELSGRAHDAGSPLVALMALAARTADDEAARAEAEPRARALCDKLRTRLGTVTLTTERAGCAPLRVGVERVRATLALSDGRVDTDGPEVEVAMPAEQLERVLENLLANGVHASPARAVLARWTATDATVRVEVHDDGAGLPSDAWPSPFRSTRKGGSGLGALTARLLVEAAGGQVGAGRSPLRGGALVHIELPKCAS